MLTINSNIPENTNTILIPNKSANTPIIREATPKIPVEIAPNEVYTVANCSLGTLVWITVCCGISLICPNSPIHSDRNKAKIGMLFKLNKMVTRKLAKKPVKIKAPILLSTKEEYLMQYTLPKIKPKKKLPLMNPHHCSPTCKASLTNIKSIAAIQTVPAMVAKKSIQAIFLKTGV